jgi:hypothetical protein
LCINKKRKGEITLFNEHPKPETRFRPILPIRIKNTIHRHPDVPVLVFDLKPIIRNGYRLGTSGFIRNLNGDIVIYVHSDSESFTAPILYRFAKDNKDFRGGINHFCNTAEELAEAVVKMMAYSPERIQAELKM